MKADAKNTGKKFGFEKNMKSHKKRPAPLRSFHSGTHYHETKGKEQKTSVISGHIKAENANISRVKLHGLREDYML